jgi:hypothetical protein
LFGLLPAEVESGNFHLWSLRNLTMLLIAQQLWYNKNNELGNCAPPTEYIVPAFLVETSPEQRIRINWAS